MQPTTGLITILGETVSQEQEEIFAARVEELRAEARRRWPGSTIADALSDLHHEILRKLVRALREGKGVKKLAVDLQLLTNERMRLQLHDVERLDTLKQMQSSLDKSQGVRITIF